MFRLLIQSPSLPTASRALCRVSTRNTRASLLFVERSHSSVAAASDESTSKGVFGKVACLGSGKMASAILAPMVRQGVQPAQDITIFDVNLGIAERLASDYGLGLADNIPDLVKDADLVILAVKPQNLNPAFWNELQKSQINDEAICLSIIAGKPIDCYRNGGFEKIVRSMPNTPATIGEGMTVWSSTPNLNKEERKKIRSILSCFGKSVSIMSWHNLYQAHLFSLTLVPHSFFVTDVCG
jgi:pyrroline-5-carboxylate reductase